MSKHFEPPLISTAHRRLRDAKFSYKDICAPWHAKNFDHEDLMEKYYNAGARYFMAQGTHHDHFFNYDSKINRMNRLNVGPQKDILALCKAAADKFSMYGISEYLAHLSPGGA